MNAQLLHGDALEVLKTLPDQHVHCCVTSPPYWNLRDYNTGHWEGGDAECDHKQGRQTARVDRPKESEQSNVTLWATCGRCGAARVDKQIGLEPTPELYVARLVEVFSEVRRVLREDGTLWLNLGDSYAAAGGAQIDGTKQVRGSQLGAWNGENRRPAAGLKPKDLVGIPWRVALALQADGWYLRSDIIWNKPACLPESVRDRPTKAHEYLFMFSKSEKYYYNADAIKEPVKLDTPARYDRGRSEQHKWDDGGPGDQTIGRSLKPMASKSGNKAKSWGNNESLDRAEGEGLIETHRGIPWEGDTRNKRTVWEVPDDAGALAQVLEFLAERHPEALADLTEAYRHKGDVWTVLARGFPGQHFATFPPMLIAPAILAGCPPAGKRCDCEEIIGTPTGEGESEDPSIEVGRAGLSRPRRDGEGTRPITRREQRAYAEQIKRSPHRIKMQAHCGTAFEHYIRTDRAGARPLPDHLLNHFLQEGWLTPPGPCDCPEEPAGIVLDPFCGSGTTLKTANGLCRNAVGIELSAKYIALSKDHTDQERLDFA